jgi:predicted PurR-regulated permease PerM
VRSHRIPARTTSGPVATVAPAKNRGISRGFLLTAGAMGAVALALCLFGIRGIVVIVFMAMFVTVGLDPLIRWLQRRGFSRAWAIVTVIILIVVLFITILWLVIPTAIAQLEELAIAIPKQIEELEDEGWFGPVNQSTNGTLSAFLAWIEQSLSDPAVRAALLNGLVGFGLSVANAISSGFFTFVLVIYFIATYDSIKDSAYRFVAASRRVSFVDYSERILQNVGRYLNGMVILAFMNASFSFLLLTLVGVPGAFVIGIIAFFITIIPLIGTVLTTIAMTIVTFIYSPPAALAVLIAMLIYMQVEAYIFSPKVMSKAVQVPGSVVLISAMAGATLFGLAGALIAIPISAAVIIIIRGVVWPEKERE